MSSPPASSPPAGASSPLFFPSSTPSRRQNPISSPLRPASNEDDTLADRTQRMNLRDMSSPLRYSSSPPPVDQPSSAAVQRTRSSARMGSSTLFSDLGSDASQSRRVYSARQRRGDIHSSDLLATPSRRFVYENVNDGINNLGSQASFSVQGPSSELGDEPVRVIWGTNVSITDSITSFRTFLQGFKQKYRLAYENQYAATSEGEELVYMDMLRQMRTLGLSNLNLDVKNLLAFPRTEKLYYQLINYPQEIIPIMDQTIKDLMISIVSAENSSQGELDEIELKVYRVRPFGLDQQTGMRELNPGDIDKLVAVKGLVIRASPIVPDMKQAFFKCSVCNHTIEVEIDRGTIAEPTKCPRQQCAQKNSMQLVHNRSTFSDKQIVRLQETPDVTPDGQTPHSISLCVYDELVDVSRAGDRVEITGIFRSVPVRVNPRQRTLKSLFKTYIDVVHIAKVDKKRMDLDTTSTAMDLETEMAELQQEAQQQKEVQEISRLSDEDVARIKMTGARDDIYELLARSLAPSIFEQDDVKKGILLQLFGGTIKTFEKGGSPRYRGDINVLLCGDPSTSKSQILKYVHRIAPRGIYTSGKGSSAVGLTAYVTRDIETKQLVLESGALVLSDGGICCIDEFDKMSDATRSVLHEVMEQQTVSIAKAGIITTLNARTSLLASANPIESKYDPTKSVPQNIDLPPTLLSRFDLVYLMLDKIDTHSDRQLAHHLTSMYLDDVQETAAIGEILPIEFLTMYISYAKQHVHPQITPAAKEELVKSYVAMRKLGEDARTSEKRITATTRQLESMIRLSEAHAKMRLSEEVTVEDVLEAVRLIRSAIKEYAMDPLTGTIDMDLVQTGSSTAQRRLYADLKTHVLNMIDAETGDGKPDFITFERLLRRINETSPRRVENLELGTAIRDLAKEGDVSVKGLSSRREIRKIG